ncbi:MAG TPA: hypothetical protein VEC08_04795, partial [Nitrososphaerales archaeon]|nr:hypothetical protein [Nitrososphaerales archaeon]
MLQGSTRWRVFNVAFVAYVLAVAAGASYVVGAGNQISAATRFPSGGTAFDTAGNLLISDQFNNRVIEVDP